MGPQAAAKPLGQNWTRDGFDYVFRENLGTADCMLRDGRASKEACHLGIEPWAQLEVTEVTQFGAANRYELIERNVERHMNCSQWREEINEKLHKVGGAKRLEDLS
ncbi:unnamed protein product [Effrenium voratum]|nr:unnamed protein product [Effrenium voratum]